jgi:acyl-coenzyme A thioesterase PaaI-like protein
MSTTAHSPFWQPRPSARARRHTHLASVPGTAGDLDLLLEEISPGHAVFSTHGRIMGRNPGALTNGGLSSTLLDFALSAAVQSHLEAGSNYRILEFKMSNVSPQRHFDGVVSAVANVLQAGSRRVWAGARVLDAGGSVLAVGSLVAAVENDDSDA